ncbi:MAG: sulfatase-like hydrolase/transferase [Bacteroidales bacterium]|nr:sulfatase-like hydrolase/transferase [Bacteroidales bacterium]
MANMKQYIVTLIKLFLFWLLFFAVGRLLFLMVYHHALVSIPWGEIVTCFWHALRLDISTACYLLTIPIILLCIKLCTSRRWVDILFYIVFTIELFVCSLIILGEICVYGEWGDKLSYKILLYLQHPMEIITTATTLQLIFTVICVTVFVAGGLRLCRKHIWKAAIAVKKHRYTKAISALLIWGGLCFLGMRGGWDAIPITQSAAYYSHHNILNDAAVNPHWNLLYSIAYFHNADPHRYHYTDDATAERIFTELLDTEKDSITHILTHNKVNVVIILLESWSADLIESLSGSKHITDNFNELVKNGILFTRTYANGHRSQQAICSIFSGFPSVPMYDITDNHNKYRHLPSWPQIMNEAGYHTSFYFGGNLDYGNIRSFLLHCNFDSIIEGSDMPSTLPRGKLGVPDEYMFAAHADALHSMQEPFMSVLFTLSSHSPYDQPKNTEEVDIQCEETPFLNSVKYCDHWLGAYFDKIKNEPWYANTLFILVGDHSHPTHISKKYHFSSDYQHIPLLFYGEPLIPELRGTENDIVCSHVDLALSVLSQMNLDNDMFAWGKNIFNPYSPQFAFYEALSGYGWIRPQAEYAEFHNGSKYFSYGLGDSTCHPVLKQEGRAYLQHLYNTYIHY